MSLRGGECRENKIGEERGECGEGGGTTEAGDWSAGGVAVAEGSATVEGAGCGPCEETMAGEEWIESRGIESSRSNRAVREQRSSGSRKRWVHGQCGEGHRAAGDVTAVRQQDTIRGANLKIPTPGISVGSLHHSMQATCLKQCANQLFGRLRSQRMSTPRG